MEKHGFCKENGFHGEYQLKMLALSIPLGLNFGQLRLVHLAPERERERLPGWENGHRVDYACGKDWKIDYMLYIYNSGKSQEYSIILY